MAVLRYSEWKDTALVLHLVMQMMGKVMLARMEPQPEWRHIVLDAGADGFSTGLIPNKDKGFSISVNPRSGKVTAARIDGKTSGFTFENNVAVCEYHEKFRRMLAEINCETAMYTIPMEMSTTTPFEKDVKKREYNPESAAAFFNMCVFAYGALLEFVAPYRGKKMRPSFFWGTFDLSALLFSGKPAPFNGGGIIEKGAFDEQMMEFGFWPGDDQEDEPSFYILPYPFPVKDLGNAGIRPDKAFYGKEKKEFFLTLKDALGYPDPEKAVLEFFKSGYDIVTREEKWNNLEWLNKPLLITKGSTALK